MKTIKSSEIASYLFCSVCWWTERMNGVKITKAISKGEKYHNLIAENQSKARFLYVCMIIMIVVVITLIVYRFLG
ncbi:hypothetical protein HYX04_01340 [Candidatus Woesearchaeota archaeon]|nr:hypothetical protein [Candidatus Woesearchaeota archaeon]